MKKLKMPKTSYIPESSMGTGYIKYNILFSNKETADKAHPETINGVDYINCSQCVPELLTTIKDLIDKKNKKA